LGRNFYKGLRGDAINIMLAAAAFNFKRAMRVLLCLIRKWIFTSEKTNKSDYRFQLIEFVA
ncbi:MAG: hypothetical protein PHG27_01045, partial [Massilibacteroides sp.]|nr:hypothetical protein [Massilibacteroides sp.]